MPDPKRNTVLVPQQSVVGRISPFHTVGWTMLVLDKETETYPIKGGGNGLSKSALNKIASAAGMRVLSSRQVGDITPDHLIWQVEVELPLANAKPVRGIGTKEWMKGVGKDGTDIEHRISKTETKATLRAIRQVLGVRTKYTDEEISRPIAVPHIDYNPDLTDEGVRDVMRQRALMAESDLFGTLPDVDDDTMPPPEVVTPDGSTVNTETGEIIEDADYVVIEEDDPFGKVAPSDDDSELKELRGLQAYHLASEASPFNGWSFAEIWQQTDGGGRSWFEQVIRWGEAQESMQPKNKVNVDNAVRFLALIDTHGGDLV